MHILLWISRRKSDTRLNVSKVVEYDLQNNLSPYILMSTVTVYLRYIVNILTDAWINNLIHKFKVIKFISIPFFSHSPSLACRLVFVLYRAYRNDHKFFITLTD